MIRCCLLLRSTNNWASSCCEMTRLMATEVPEELVRKKMISKLLYRSKQRGFLELDLLVGLWAEQEVPKMNTERLQQFAVVLEQENPDLFHWLTGQVQAPPVMQQNQAYQALSQHVAAHLAANSPRAAQAAAGKQWIRGWDDHIKITAASSGAPSEEKSAAA